MMMKGGVPVHTYRVLIVVAVDFGGQERCGGRDMW